MKSTKMWSLTRRSFRTSLILLALVTVGSGLVLTSCKNADQKLVGTRPLDRRKAAGSEWQTFGSQVDILLVVDDSGSMDTHQKNLARNLDLFAEGLKANGFIDYHIGVISTAEAVATSTIGSGMGPGGGRLNGNFRFIDRTTPNGFEEMKKNILMGISGSGYERMFSPTRLALTEPNLSGWNAGFYRNSAFLAVIYITDAEDQSDRSDGSGSRPSSDPNNITPQAMYDFLVSLKGGNAQKVLVYGTWVPLGVPSATCHWDDDSMPHVRLDSFFNIAHAKTYSLCDPDYGKKLGDIGKDLTSRIGRRVMLDRRPNKETIQIFYGSQQIFPDAENGWSYDPESNSIIFGRKIIWSEQRPGTNIEVGFDPIDN